MRSAFFWNFTKRRLVVYFRRFGTTYESLTLDSREKSAANNISCVKYQKSANLKMGTPTDKTQCFHVAGVGKRKKTCICVFLWKTWRKRRLWGSWHRWEHIKMHFKTPEIKRVERIHPAQDRDKRQAHLDTSTAVPIMPWISWLVDELQAHQERLWPTQLVCRPVQDLGTDTAESCSWKE